MGRADLGQSALSVPSDRLARTFIGREFARMGAVIIAFCVGAYFKLFRGKVFMNFRHDRAPHLHSDRALLDGLLFIISAPA